MDTATATALVNVPVARGLLAIGSSRQDCIAYSRIRKSTLIALRLFGDGTDPAAHTHEDMNRLMDTAAENTGVHGPHSGETRTMVLEILKSYRSMSNPPQPGDPAPTAFTSWRIYYRDLGRSQQTELLATTEKVTKRHRYLERRAGVDSIEIRETTVIESTRIITIADLT